MKLLETDTPGKYVNLDQVMWVEKKYNGTAKLYLNKHSSKLGSYEIVCECDWDKIEKYILDNEGEFMSVKELLGEG